jgi:hypothetical protein
MKKYIYNIFKGAGLAFVFVLVLSSCDKWIDTDINIDPDAPADVPMNLMLPAIQQAMGYNLGGNDLVRVTNMWTQHFDGVVRQSETQAKYQLLPADVNNVWTSIYTEIFMNSVVFIDKAENTEGKESPHNAGVGQVMMATTLGIATDLFGDMPYSEAFQGVDNLLTPIFDSQETLYGAINSTLDAAITNLGSATNAVDIGGDVVYGGDAAAWKKAAYSIKARHALQLSARNGASAYTDALAAVTGGFSSGDDDFEVPFDADNKNPIWQFMDDRTDIRLGAPFVDMLIAAEDPRLPFFVADPDAGGSIIGSLNEDASFPGDYIAAPDASVVIMSYAELMFIKAEALFMTGGAAQAAFEEAVAASVLKVTGDANQDWLDANIVGATVTLELIMTQKYIATFGTNQPYADYRRTGFPVLTLHPRALTSAIPTRFPYGQNEIDYNGANVPSVQITDKLWWDQ